MIFPVLPHGLTFTASIDPTRVFGKIHVSVDLHQSADMHMLAAQSPTADQIKKSPGG